MKLEKGRPANLTDRLEKEIRVYDILDSLNIEYERLDHEPVFSVDEGENIKEALQPCIISKNLFLCTKKKDKFYMVVMPDYKKMNTKEFSDQIGSPRLSFGKPEYMQEYLDTTPGSVSIMGLMNDKNNNVELLIDEDVLNAEYLGCHPCINTSSLRIKVADLVEKFAPAINHEYRKVIV